jgi:hypothetical protein
MLHIAAISMVRSPLLSPWNFKAVSYLEMEVMLVEHAVVLLLLACFFAAVPTTST